jgi:hypothetical protein
MTKDAINYLETQEAALLNDQHAVGVALDKAGYHTEAMEVWDMTPERFETFATVDVC